MNRRQFFHTTALGAAGLGLAGAAGLSGPQAGWQAFARPELLSLLDDARRVRDLGVRFRRRFPDEDTSETLVHALRADCGISGALAETDLRVRLHQQVRAEFAEGRTVQLDGWILSMTEARQCALYSLTTA